MPDNVNIDNLWLAPILRFRQALWLVTTLVGNIKEWKSVVLFRAGIIKEFDITLDEKKVHIANMDDYRKVWPLDENKLFLIGTPRSGMIIGTDDRDYHFLKPKGRVVVDVGSYIGDTAIYFIQQGAKEVISYEPFPAFYNAAIRNIKVNKIKNVKLYNQAVSDKDGELRLDANTLIMQEARKNFKKGKKVRVVSLDGIAASLKSGALLKLDIEGGEYPIILNSKPDTLQKFDRIVMEYHNGYSNIARRLKELGFRVRYTGGVIGILEAERQ